MLLIKYHLTCTDSASSSDWQSFTITPDATASHQRSSCNNIKQTPSIFGKSQYSYLSGKYFI